MSRRRRRGSRRKSSSSSKRSVSPFTYQKTKKSNSVSYKDDITEKGETDSLRKEVLSASDEEDNVDESPNKEKTCGRDFRGDSILRTPTTTKQEDKGMKIITSVTIDNSQQSSPIIIFEQSHQSSFEEKTPNCPVPVTTTKVQCIGSKVNFEIQVLQSENVGRTTFVFHSQHGGNTEPCFQNQCERTLTSNDESFERAQILDVTNQSKKDGTYKFNIGEIDKGARKTLRYVIPSGSSMSACRKSCCDNDTDIPLAGGSPSPSELDSKYDILDGLTKDIENFQLGACSSPFKDQRDYSPPPSNTYKQESGCPYSVKGEESAHVLPFFDQLSESDNYEPMSTRHSFSVSRTSYTEDFIHKHEGKTWIRNNSISIVEHKPSSSASYLEKPTWRRRTFPGGSGGSEEIQEGLPSYRESFSSDTIPSFIMQSLPHQVERLGEFYQGEEGEGELSNFGIEGRKSSRSSCSYRPSSRNSSIHLERPRLSNPFCPDQILQKHVQFPEDTHVSPKDPTQPEMDFAGNMYEHLAEQKDTNDRGKVEPRERAENMCDEMHSPGPVDDELPQGDLLIQVIPPSCSTSEEHIMESSSTRSLSITLEEDACLLPNGRRGSVMTIVIGGSAQTDSKPAEGSSHEKQHRNSCNAVPEAPEDCSHEKQHRDDCNAVSEAPSVQRNVQTDSKPAEGSSHEKQHRDSCNSVSEAPEGSSHEKQHRDSCNAVSEVPEGSSHEKQHRDSCNAVSEAPSVSPILDMEERELPSTHEVIEDVHPTLSTLPPRTSMSSPSLTNTKEEKEEAPSTSSVSINQEKTKFYQTDSGKHTCKAPLEVKKLLKLQLEPVPKEPDSGPDQWATRRKVLKESRQWTSAGGNSISSDITEEPVPEDNRSTDLTVRSMEDNCFYTETYHSSSWIYKEEEEPSTNNSPPLRPQPRPVIIRERTVQICRGTGDYPWGFRLQFTKPIVVTEVDTNGAAEEAGLLVGDHVVAVNGTDVTSAPHSEAAELARIGPDLLTLTIGSDISRGPNIPRPACRGYLHKRTQSGLIKGWRERWFVLRHDCCLYYYRHKRDEGRRPALSSVKLEGAEVGPDASLGKPFVFKCCPLSADRVYFYCATSGQDMKRWLEAMERAVHPVTQRHVWVDVTHHNASLPPLAVKSPECLGLLHQIDSNKDTSWVQHYCILKDGCLYFYAGIRSTHALGGIYLQGYTVREQPLASKKSTMELSPPSDEFKTFYLCAENPTENKRWILAIKASIKKWVPLHQDYMNRLPEETRM